MITHSPRHPWQRIREAFVTSVDDLMTAAGAGGTPTKDWDSRPKEGYTKDIPLGAQGVFVSLMMDKSSAWEGTPDEFATVNIYVRQEKGPAEFVVSGTFTAGLQLVVKDPTLDTSPDVDYRYPETFAITDQGHPEGKLTISPPDGVGSDDIGGVYFAIFGAGYIEVEIAALDTDVSVVPIMKYS